MTPRASRCKTALSGMVMMALPTLVSAANGDEEAASTGAVVEFDTALLLVVLVCLGYLARTVAELNRQVHELLAERDPARVGDAPPPPDATRPVPAADRPDPHVLAAITAAVYAVTERPMRIVSVDDVTSDHSHTWSLEGRRQIFSSHRVR